MVRKNKKHKPNHDIVQTVNQVCICQVCLETPRDNIYQCEDGHIICFECKRTYLSYTRKSSARECPTCKIDTNFSIRNTILEQIADSLELSCKYKPNGCNHKSNKISRLRHEMECVFYTRCCFPECKYRFDDEFPNMNMKHIVEKHLYMWSDFDTWNCFTNSETIGRDLAVKSWCAGIPLKHNSGLYLLRIKCLQDTKSIRFCAFRIYSPSNSIHNSIHDSILNIKSFIKTKSRYVIRNVPVFINDVNVNFFEELDLNFENFDFDHNLTDEPDYTTVPSHMFNYMKFSITQPNVSNKNLTESQKNTCPHYGFEQETDDESQDS